MGAPWVLRDRGINEVNEVNQYVKTHRKRTEEDCILFTSERSVCSSGLVAAVSVGMPLLYT